MDLRERAAGCLLCGAVGDALGFAVEFIPLSEILRRHGEDIGAALAAAVNHSGDSDSTGAVTGNFLGAFFGERAVPRRFTERLELADLLKESAVALADEAERARGTV